MKPLFWVGKSRDDLRRLPEAVRRDMGFALQFAQEGGKHPSAKPLKGLGDAGVLEIVERNRGDTYRAVYTIRFADAVYVLHVFMKKSKQGIATPRSDMKLIASRLAMAEKHHQAWMKGQLDEKA